MPHPPTAPLALNSTETGPLIDPAALEALGRLRPQASAQFIQQVLGAYLKSLDKHAPKVEQAWQEGALQHVADNAHALKSASASVGALRFSQTCHAVEQAARQGQTQALATWVPEFVAQAQAVAHAAQALTEVPK